MMKQTQEQLKITQVLPRIVAQASIDGDLELPAGSADMGSILTVEAYPDIQSAEAVEGGVVMDGTADITVLYVDTEGNPEGITLTTGFKHTAQAPGVTPGMDVDADPQVISLTYDMKDPRSLSVQAVVEMDISAQGEKDVSVMQNAAADGLQLLAQRRPVPDRCCTQSSSTVVREDVAIAQGEPPAIRVLSCRGYSRVNTSRFEDHRLIVRGTLFLTIMYATANPRRPVAQTTRSLPFEQMLMMDGCTSCDRKRVRSFVRDANCRMEDEGRVFSTAATIVVNARCCDMRMLETVADAYSTQRRVGVTPVDIGWQGNPVEASGAVSLREMAPVPEGMPEMEEPMFILATPMVTGKMATESMISVEGLVMCKVVYMTQDGMLAAYPVEVPFMSQMRADGAMDGMDIEAKVMVEQVSMGMNGELRIEMQVEARAAGMEKMTAVSELSDEGELETGRGIIVHFTGENDTPWSIAKEYALTPDELAKMNPGMKDEAVVGQKIIIFKPFEMPM